jgi:hypothetical protein
MPAVSALRSFPLNWGVGYGRCSARVPDLTRKPGCGKLRKKFESVRSQMIPTLNALIAAVVLVLVIELLSIKELVAVGSHSR